MEQKKCLKCGLLKSVEKFDRDRTTKDGFHYRCKLCKYGKERPLKIRRQFDIEYFKQVCQNSITMADAARELQLPFVTFKHHALKFGVYTPNQSGRGKTKRTRDFIDLDLVLQNKIPCRSSVLKQKLFAAGLKTPQCERCGIIEWMGRSLSFHPHHKDGNRFNNFLENIEILCPNCHSQTDTFCGRKNGKLGELGIATSLRS